MVRVNSLVLVLAALMLVAAAQARLGPSVTTVRPTPMRPMQGPVIRTTGVGPYGGVHTSASTTRATPLRPFTGPVTTTTGAGPGYAYGGRSAVHATPLNPYVGPVRVGYGGRKKDKKSGAARLSDGDHWTST